MNPGIIVTTSWQSMGGQDLNCTHALSDLDILPALGITIQSGVDASRECLDRLRPWSWQASDPGKYEKALPVPLDQIHWLEYGVLAQAVSRQSTRLSSMRIWPRIYEQIRSRNESAGNGMTLSSWVITKRTSVCQRIASSMTRPPFCDGFCGKKCGSRDGSN